MEVPGDAIVSLALDEHSEFKWCGFKEAQDLMRWRIKSRAEVAGKELDLKIAGLPRFEPEHSISYFSADFQAMAGPTRLFFFILLPFIPVEKAFKTGMKDAVEGAPRHYVTKFV